MRLVKLLILVLIYLLGLSLSFAKPDLDNATIITKRFCENHEKRIFVCTMVYKDGDRYIVIDGWNGQYEIYKLVKGKYELVWSRYET